MDTPDVVRALALLWRAASDPDGAQVYSPDDTRTADLLHVSGLGHVEKRRPKAHQLSMFSHLQGVDGADLWLTYFVINEQGEDLWDEVLELVESAIAAAPPLEQPGKDEL